MRLLLLCDNAARETVADVLHLHHGGKIEGELLNPNESPREKYIMRLAEGGEVTFKVDLVEKFVPLSQNQKRYRQVVTNMPNTAAGNWKMADWCKKIGLRQERRFHAEETVRLDPDHTAARQFLGYIRLEGEWTTRDAFNKKRGFVKHQGVWRLPQEVALLKQQRQTELAVKGWFKKSNNGAAGSVTRNAKPTP